jgi:hypothetical protein
VQKDSSQARLPPPRHISLFAALEVATGKITADAWYLLHINVEFVA